MDAYLHQLYEKYYANKRKQHDREICIRCGHARVLGIRGKAKGLCKTCRKQGKPI